MICSSVLRYPISVVVEECRQDRVRTSKVYCQRKEKISFVVVNSARSQEKLRVRFLWVLRWETEYPRLEVQVNYGRRERM